MKKAKAQSLSFSPSVRAAKRRGNPEQKKDSRKLLFLQKNFLDPESAKESLDMVLAAASLEFYVSLFFMGDSVFQLINSEENPLSGLLKALPVYDIQKIYVTQESLDQRNLLPENLILPVIVLLPHEINSVINQYDTVVS